MLLAYEYFDTLLAMLCCQMTGVFYFAEGTARRNKRSQKVREKAHGFSLLVNSMISRPPTLLIITC